MVITSAPGKVILFGEHAVVYGEPALAGAIERRVYVEMEESRRNGLTISSEGVEDGDEYALRYLRKAVEVALVDLGADRDRGLEVRVASHITTASGLGSSAAVSVATILAVSRLLDAELSGEALAGLGHQVELQVQGAASPTDTLTSALGGVLYIEPGKGYKRIAVSIPLVVGCTGDPRATKEMVRGVRDLRDRYPGIVGPIIKSIGEVTREAKVCLEERRDIGELMNINHGLLEALGVGTKGLSHLVHAARVAGASGAKITGAGGGGSMIAYAPREVERVVRAIEGLGCTAFQVSIAVEGARVEKKGLL
ncbi:MAG: mevalonate kinase [Candidatus Hydrothermarchaeota archaeon]